MLFFALAGCRNAFLWLLLQASYTHNAVHQRRWTELAICQRCLTRHLIWLCPVFFCCPVSTDVWPHFFLLFLFFSSSPLPPERPPIGFGGGRRLCGIIMGSSWEICPWKGLSENERKTKFGLVSDPSWRHSSGHSEGRSPNINPPPPSPHVPQIR